MYGQRGGHSHSRVRLTIESYLYSSWESAAPFETHFHAKVENSSRFNDGLFPSCARMCPDAASNIGEISGFFGNIIKKTWRSLSAIGEAFLSDYRFQKAFLERLVKKLSE